MSEFDAQNSKDTHLISGSNPLPTAKIICDLCQKQFSKMGIGSHKWRVHGDGKTFIPTRNPPWNKGLTAATDQRIDKSAKLQSARYASGEIKAWQRGLTKETSASIAKQALRASRTIEEKIRKGSWHNSFARSKKQTYKGESFDGMWEVKLATWFDDQGISWRRNKESFSYEFDKPRRYTPDFFLPDVGCFVEVKGWTTEKDIAKWSQFPKDKQLLILTGVELKALGLDVQVRKQKRT